MLCIPRRERCWVLNVPKRRKPSVGYYLDMVASMGLLVRLSFATAELEVIRLGI
jgi:hypothetical protein